jgi:hypothetical protein
MEEILSMRYYSMIPGVDMLVLIFSKEGQNAY